MFPLPLANNFKNIRFLWYILCLLLNHLTLTSKMRVDVFLLWFLQIQLMGNPEINSNNPDSILQTVKIHRKSKFFRHLAKQYCWLYCSFFVMENHVKDGFSRDMSRLSPSDFNKLVLSCLVQHWASFWYKSNPKFYVV